MSRPYKITEAHRQQILQDFYEALVKNPITNGTLTYSKTLDCGKATILFTPKAYMKQAALVRETSSEIGWHGVVRRAESDERTFIVEDIFVYPQKVTGTSINPDQQEYNDWQDSFDDDTFNAMRFHGHSHVNMGVFSSSVDDGYQNGLIEQLGPEMFQIFMILNKRGEHWQRIVDLKNNIVFDTADIQIGLTDCGFDYSAFLADAKAKLKPDAPANPVHSKLTPAEVSRFQSAPANHWSYQPPASAAPKQKKSTGFDAANEYREAHPDECRFTPSGYFGDDGVWYMYDAWPEGMEEFE